MKTFHFAYVQAGAVPPAQPLRIYLTDETTGETLNLAEAVTLRCSAGWFSVIPLSGNTVVDATVQLTENAIVLEPGIYGGQITIASTSQNIVNSPQVANVELEVIAKAEPPIEPPIDPPEEQVSLVLAPVTFHFLYKKPGNLPSQQSFQVLSSTGLPIDVEIYSGSDWLAVTPAEGLTTLTSNVKLHNSVKKMLAGQYTAEIEVQSDAAANSPQLATVTLEVIEKNQTGKKP